MIILFCLPSPTILCPHPVSHKKILSEGDISGKEEGRNKAILIILIVSLLPPLTLPINPLPQSQG